MTTQPMANTYTWHIAQLERETSDGYVFVAHYTVDAKSDDAVYSAGAYGSLGLERPEGDLIPYSELTEDVVVAWVLQKLGDEKVLEIHAALDSQIDEQRQPSKQAGVPWQ
jgi:hypothetical protein